ncbi:MAG: hypothetical protein ACEPOV_09190 [Hyphomicrobiales bacterium]
MENTTHNNHIRPTSVSVLLILSMINGGLNFLTYLFLGFNHEFIVNQLDLYKSFVKTFGADMNLLDFITKVSPAFFIITGIVSGISFLGALLIWKRNNIGLHLYAIAQIIILIVGSYFKMYGGFPLLPVLITLGFIFIYYSYLRRSSQQQ